MSHIRPLILLTPILLFVLACQAITRPFDDVQNMANTAEAIVTQANELSTQAVTVETEVAVTEGAAATFVPEDPNATVVPGNLFDPQGEPLDSWKDIPIMPKAIAGEEVDAVYSFKVEASLREVHDFYAAELPPLGWSALFAGEDYPIEVYSKGDQVLTITITEQDGGTVVLLSIS